MSGTSRLPSPGTPVPLCHDGLEKIVLAPPPPALRPLELVSFHVFSGMYSRADGPLFKFEELFQYGGSAGATPPLHPLVALQVAASPVNSLPPTPVTSG